MKYIFTFIIFLISSKLINAQSVSLFDFNISVRTDTAFWHKDFKKLNSDYNRQVNKCQLCVSDQKENVRQKFCTNTTLAHVKLDSAFFSITPKLIQGKWEIINAGVIEITDSMRADFRITRKEKLINDQFDLTGSVEFSDNKVKLSIKQKNKTSEKKQFFQILNKRFLITKSLFKECGPSVIGITNNGYLIIDQYSYKEIASKESYWVYKTFISRTILKKA